MTMVDTKIDRFVQESRKHHYDAAYAAWSEIGSAFMSKRLLFTQATDPASVLKMTDLLPKRLQAKKVIETFTANGLAAADLTPFQRDITEKILRKAQPPDGDKV